MKRWQRNATRRIAGKLLGLAEWCERTSETLYARAERKARPRPLVFPSAMDLMLDDLLRRSTRNLMDRITWEIMEGPRIVRVRVDPDDCPHLIIKGTRYDAD